MARFEYAGRGSGGRLIEGYMEAIDAVAVAVQLESDGMVPLRIQPRQKQDMDFAMLLERAGVGMPKTIDLILFSRQMMSITKSGMPLLRGLKSLATSTRNPILRRTLGEILVDLESGRELASAFARHPRVFSDLYVSLIRVGEHTGTLEKSFAKLTDYLGAQQDLRDRVSSAMRYPLIVIAAIIAAMAVLTVFVIPKFEPMFRQLGEHLPLPTRVLLATSGFVQHHWLLTLSMLATVAVSWSLFIRSPAGRLRWHQWQLHVPVFGKLIEESILARALGTLSMTLAAGLPILEALKLIARSAGNDFMTARIERLRELVQTGSPIGRAAAAANLMPPLVVQMIEVGEETGELTRLLDEVAGFYQREVDYTLKNLTALIEPIMILVVGSMVLVLALGIFLPMWEMLSKMSGAA
jgi:MSHA biogenesis protein MshG